jgi:hypothetical protein
MSAIALSVPAMCSGVKLDACLACILIPIMRRSLAAMLEEDVRSVVAQETAAVLSQNIPMCLCFKGICSDSSSSQFSVAPASSKSFIVIFPVLFVEETMLF